MKQFIIETKEGKFLVLAKDEDDAKIKFSFNYPSYKMRSITPTLKDVYQLL